MNFLFHIEWELRGTSRNFVELREWVLLVFGVCLKIKQLQTLQTEMNLEAESSKIETLVPYIRKGRPRKPDSEIAESTLRVRKHSERHRFSEVVADTATHAIAKLAHEFVPKHLEPQAERSLAEASQVTLQLLADSAPEIAKVLIDKSKAGDIQATQLLTKHLFPQLKTRLNLPKCDSIEETAYQVMVGSMNGTIALEDAQKALDVIVKTSEVMGNAVMAQRLAIVQMALRDTPIRYEGEVVEVFTPIKATQVNKESV